MSKLQYEIRIIFKLVAGVTFIDNPKQQQTCISKIKMLFYKKKWS